MKHLVYSLLCIFVLITLKGCSKSKEFGQRQTAAPELFVTTIAGSSTGFSDGRGNSAKFSGPDGVAMDLLGNIIVSDGYNNRIRKIDSIGNVTTIAGTGSIGFNDGTSNFATFYYPAGIVVDPTGSIFICDEFNHQIRKIAPTGVVSTFAGSRSTAPTRISLRYPVGMAIDASANLYVADMDNNAIRKISPDGRAITLGSGASGYADGNSTVAMFRTPTGVAIDKFNNIYVADRGNNRIRKITEDGKVSTIAGNGNAGSADGTNINATFNGLSHIAVDDSLNLFVTQYEDHRIRKITPTGNVTTFAGSGVIGQKDGPISTAQFFNPTAITIDKKGNIFIADMGNNAIRKIFIK